MARSVPYLAGRLAGRQFRKAKWIWESVAGGEDDAIRAEQAVGRDMAAVVRERSPGPAAPDVQALLDGVASTLAGRVRNRVHRFEVAALAGGHPTAFALPGGFIFVAAPLVDLAGRGRDELAFVIAHEMAHVMRRHAMERLLSRKAISAVALATPAARAIAPWLRNVGVRWLENAYSREQEFEADELGALLMRAAGFDVRGAVRILERLGCLDPAGDPPGPAAYLSTHPPVRDRIRRLRDLLDPSGA